MNSGSFSLEPVSQDGVLVTIATMTSAIVTLSLIHI